MGHQGEKCRDHRQEHRLPVVRQGCRRSRELLYFGFPGSRLEAVCRAPDDCPWGKKGDVLTVRFIWAGIPCMGLNGGPSFRPDEAFSFQIATDDQHETDRYWNAIVGNGGTESECGWCKDRWGLSWQITPRTLTEAMMAGGDGARRAFGAMMTMRKIDVAAIDAARRG